MPVSITEELYKDLIVYLDQVPDSGSDLLLNRLSEARSLGRRGVSGLIVKGRTDLQVGENVVLKKGYPIGGENLLDIQRRSYLEFDENYTVFGVLGDQIKVSGISYYLPARFFKRVAAPSSDFISVEKGDIVRFKSPGPLGYITEETTVARKLMNLTSGSYYRVLFVKRAHEDVFLSLHGVDGEIPSRFFEKVEFVDGKDGLVSYGREIGSCKERVSYTPDGITRTRVPLDSEIKGGDWIEFLGVPSSGYAGPFDDPSLILKVGDKYQIKSVGSRQVVELIGFPDVPFELEYFKKYKS